MKSAILAALLGLSVVGCTDNQQAVISAIPAVVAVASPTATTNEKICAVLDWGVPVAKSRYGTYTVHGQSVVAASAQVAEGYCRLKNASWRDRASEAANELVAVLWQMSR